VVGDTVQALVVAVDRVRKVQRAGGANPDQVLEPALGAGEFVTYRRRFQMGIGCQDLKGLHADLARCLPVVQIKAIALRLGLCIKPRAVDQFLQILLGGTQ
jgi:hypothetical protein